MHFEGNLHLWEDRFILSKDNCDISIIVLEVFSIFDPYRHSVICEGMRNCAVGSISDKKDTVCLHKLRNRYLGRESEGKNGLILKGDFLGFYKQYRNLFDDDTVGVLIISFGALERLLYRTVLGAAISPDAVAIIALKGKGYSVSANFSACIIDAVEPLLAKAFIAYWSRMKILTLIA